MECKGCGTEIKDKHKRLDTGEEIWLCFACGSKSKDGIDWDVPENIEDIKKIMREE